MKKMIVLFFGLFFGMLYTAEAQSVVHLDEIHHPSDQANLHDELLLNDKHSDAHMIWAPAGFKKNRNGAPVYEQIFVLEGKGMFTFDGDTTEVSRGSWVVIPANTAHTIEVVGDESLKMLAIQKK